MEETIMEHDPNKREVLSLNWRKKHKERKNRAKLNAKQALALSVFESEKSKRNFSLSMGASFLGGGKATGRGNLHGSSERFVNHGVSHYFLDGTIGLEAGKSRGSLEGWGRG